MLPKYLPPPYDQKFYDSLENAGKLNLKDVFKFVHGLIRIHEEQGLEPLEALDRTHNMIAQSLKP